MFLSAMCYIGIAAMAMVVALVIWNFLVRSGETGIHEEDEA